jgi:hypothetical protein
LLSQQVFDFIPCFEVSPFPQQRRLGCRKAELATTPPSNLHLSTRIKNPASRNVAEHLLPISGDDRKWSIVATHGNENQSFGGGNVQCPLSEGKGLLWH